MYFPTYILGSYYIIRSLFRFSNYVTNYLFDHKIINLPIAKHEKINESIYSSLHGILITTLSATSIMFNNENEHKDNKLQYFTTTMCISYFFVDLFKCLYHKKYLFIIHHLASIYLLLIQLCSFYLYQNKGIYAMYLIFLLESNTVLLNIGFLLKEFKFHYSITCTMWIIHLICFALCRLITVPKIIFLLYFYEKRDILSVMLIPAFMLILSGSIYWSYRQTIGIQKYLKENCVI